MARSTPRRRASGETVTSVISHASTVRPGHVVSGCTKSSKVAAGRRAAGSSPGA